MHGKYLPILWYNELVDYRDYREFVTFSNIVVNEKRNGQVVSEKKVCYDCERNPIASFIKHFI